MKQFSHNAWISWLPQQKGGRARVPTSQYRLSVHVEGQKNWPAEGWTLVIKPSKLFNGSRLQNVKIGFLTDTAPRDLLTAGARFDLLDGPKVVAHGLVVDDRMVKRTSRTAMQKVLPV